MAKKLIGSAALTPSSDTGFDLTTKGDTHGYSDQNARIPISTNNFSLLCDSAESLGLKWAASPTSVLSGAQDILYSSAANTLARLAAGTDGALLTTHGTGSAPTWESPSAGATTTTTSAWIEISFTTTSTTFVDATDYTHTLTNVTGGSYMLVFSFCFSITVINASTRIRAVHGTTNLTEWFVNSIAWMADQSSGAQSYVGDTDGSVVKIQTKISTGTFNLINTSNRGEGSFLEVS